MSNIAHNVRRLLRPQQVSTFTKYTRVAPIARLHQQGPSRSAVVHEQALPHSQSEGAAFLSQTKCQTSSLHNTHHDSTTLENLVSQIPLVQSLRETHSSYKESRPHLAIPSPIRQSHLVGGSLTGPGKLPFAPYMWLSTGQSDGKATGERNSRVVSVFHIGQDLCGHPGFVHGGLLTVLFDEVFARCVSAAFPSGLGMTANLNVDFRKPALPDRMYVLRTETVKVEGRKAWVEGRMSYLPLALPADAKTIVPDVSQLREDSEGAVMVAEGKALFVEPKFADSMVSIYRS
ncbi:Thioesterase superfamily [Penicillium bovifimosum]|uniref:Thioesterase superfamily n=1 Tax=Penicillium bovifimosum TaxID=126998 RepID=A0A9W9L084_9EURO|nr:Thioesterase superfamily [Penicillium bovifimosum]KAJ5129500.1 Thioesterase superfamily [Penicillium bovifimosum]